LTRWYYLNQQSTNFIKSLHHSFRCC